MSETTTISASDVLCNLKAVVADLECQQKQQIFKQLQQQLQQEQELRKRQEQQENEREKKAPVQQPMYLMVPIEDTKKIEAEKLCHSAHNHRNCNSSKGSTQSGEKTQKSEHNKKNHHTDPLELKGSKSRELRAGILYTGCGCLHRDGLQDNCPRSECQGQPLCLTKPWATCPPGIRCRIRHPEIFGAPPNPEAVTF